MGSCNVVQNEIGGKELLLKACQGRIASTIAAVAASLIDQGITYTAKKKGLIGNNIRIVLLDPAANNATLSISVAETIVSGVTIKTITVSLATDGTGDITSTADQIIAAIVASTPASALVSVSGTGAVAVNALASTPLAGGIDGAVTVTLPILVKKGDIVRPMTIGALTSLVVGKFYAIVEVVSTTQFKISSVLGGEPIEIDAAETGLEFDIFSTLGGLRSKSFGFASESVDITNGDSDEWRKILDKAGQRSFTVSGSGVYTNEEVFQSVFKAARENLLTCLMFIEVKTGTIFAGCFKIPSLEVAGDYNAESSYSISAESSGEIVVEKME